MQIWRETATGQAVAAAASTRGAGRGRRRGRGTRVGRGLSRKRGTEWLIFGDGDETTHVPLAQIPPEPEEYQSVEVNNTQTAPGNFSDED